MSQPKHTLAAPPNNAATAANGFNIENEKLFDRQDLLQMLHISVRTLQYWRTKGILPYSKIGNKIFYRKKDVEEMLLKNRRLGNK